MKGFISSRSEFTKNVITLMTGTSIAQAIPIAITPLLTRMYTPSEFGVFALFISITLILGTVANARFELAIVLPERDNDAITISALCLVVSSSFSVFLAIPFILFNDNVAQLLGNVEIKFWLNFVPLVVFLIGCYNILNFLNTRLCNYQDIAKSHIYRTVYLSFTQLILGYLKFISSGLIIGQVMSHFASIYGLSKNISIVTILKRTLCFWELKKVAIRFKRFPLIMLPASLMNTISGNILPMTLPILFSMGSLGYYSLAQRALGAPSALIGSSISQVFIQQASKEKIETGKVIQVFDRTLLKLVVISSSIFLPLYFCVVDLFSFIFGVEWYQAGVYTKILLPYFGINFIVSSLSMTDSIMEKQHYYAYFNLVMLIGLVSLVYFIDFLSVEALLQLVALYLSCIYTVYLFVIRLVAQGKL